MPYSEVESEEKYKVAIECSSEVRKRYGGAIIRRTQDTIVPPGESAVEVLEPYASHELWLPLHNWEKKMQDNLQEDEEMNIFMDEEERSVSLVKFIDTEQ
jgi:hypothetical protein